MFRPLKATHISEYESLITPEDGFTKRVDTERGYIAYDTGIFSDPGKFPEVNSSMDENTIRKNLLRRDLRGIKFSLKTGNTICRPLTKFFNIGEREESFISNIDLSLPSELLVKLDGSMISAMIPDDGNLYYTTKKGVTPISSQIVDYVKRKSNSIGYDDFNNKLIGDGFTPVYEWCSRRQRIVLDYPEDSLTLIALRHIEEGYFISTDEMRHLSKDYDIPVIQTVNLEYENLTELVNITKGLIGEEGYVLIVGGDRFKIKADDYCRIHKTLEGLVFEKDIISTICENKLDDIIPFLPADVAIKVKNFQSDLINNITTTAKNLIDDVYSNMVECKTKKDFVFKIIDKPSHIKPQMFTIYDLIKSGSENIVDEVIGILTKLIIKHCTSASRVESIRWIFNVKWDDYYINNI